MSDANDTAVDIEQEKAKLLELIEANRKKGKNPIREVIDEFTATWLRLARATELDDETIGYLFDGLYITGARPLYLYALDAGVDRTYQQLFNSNRTIDNKAGETFKLALSLISLELISPTSTEQLADISDRLQGLSKTKKRKRWSDFEGAARRFLIQPLVGQRINEKARLPEASARSLLRLFGSILERRTAYSSTTDEEREAILALLVWLERQARSGGTTTEQTMGSSGNADETVNDEALANPENLTNMESNEAHEEEIETPGSSNRLHSSTIAESSENDTPHCDATMQVKTTTEKNNTRKHGMTKVINYLLDYEKEFDDFITAHRQLQSKHKQLKSEHVETLKELSDLEKALESAQFEVEKLLSQRTSLSGNYADLQGRLDRVNAENASLKNDLAAAEEMLTMLEERDAHAADVSDQKMVRELRFEYEQFSEAMADDMTAELGEVMRDLLGNVFGILKSNGIDL